MIKAIKSLTLAAIFMVSAGAQAHGFHYEMWWSLPTEELLMMRTHTTSSKLCDKVAKMENESIKFPVKMGYYKYYCKRR